MWCDVGGAGGRRGALTDVFVVGASRRQPHAAFSAIAVAAAEGRCRRASELLRQRRTRQAWLGDERDRHLPTLVTVLNVQPRRRDDAFRRRQRRSRRAPCDEHSVVLTTTGRVYTFGGGVQRRIGHRVPEPAVSGSGRRRPRRHRGDRRRRGAHARARRRRHAVAFVVEWQRPARHRWHRGRGHPCRRRRRRRVSGESDEEVSREAARLGAAGPSYISAFLTAYMIAGDAARRPRLLRAGPHALKLGMNETLTSGYSSPRTRTKHGPRRSPPSQGV